MNLNFTKQQTRNMARAALSVLAMVAAMVALLAIAPASPKVEAQGGGSEVRFRNVRVDGITNLRGAVMMGSAVTMNDTLDVANDATIGGDLTVTGVIPTEGGYIGITPVPTVTAPGISTPQAVQHSLGADPGNTYWNTSHTNSSGVVTVKVWQNMLSGTVTPQAATTAVAVDVCVMGQ